MPPPLYWRSSDDSSSDKHSSSKGHRRQSYAGPVELSVFAEFTKEKKKHYERLPTSDTATRRASTVSSRTSSTTGTGSSLSIHPSSTSRRLTTSFTEQYLIGAGNSFDGSPRDTWDGIPSHTMLHDVTQRARAAVDTPKVIWHCQIHKIQACEPYILKREILNGRSKAKDCQGLVDCICYKWGIR